MNHTNLVDLKKFKNNKKRKEMIGIILVLSLILAMVSWKFLIKEQDDIDFIIPPSSNSTYDTKNINQLTPNNIAEALDDNSDSPILLHIYATWCKVCKKQLPTINEAARKFQNTDLKVLAVAIDKNIDNKILRNYLDKYGDIYFQPNYLLYSDGLGDLLQKRKIKYNRTIPTTVVINRGGEVNSRFTGYKRSKYLERKIIESLKQNDANKII
jgi:thiol-disulfide isomerase/thioredoxin